MSLMISTKHGIDYTEYGKSDRKRKLIQKPLCYMVETTFVVMKYIELKMDIDVADQTSS